MVILTHINVPADAVERMCKEYCMDASDMKKAMEAYMAEILKRYDDGVITFFQFLQRDSETEQEFAKV